MAFWCGFAADLGQPAHTHETSDEMRQAHGITTPAPEVTSPPVTAQPVPVAPRPTPAPAGPHAGTGALWEPMTPAQRAYAERLGLDVRACTLLGKRGVSALIDVATNQVPLHTAVERLHGAQAQRIGAPPAPAPVAPVAAPEYTPSYQKTLDPNLIEMLKLIGDGRYATRTDPNEPFLFYKVDHPKTGRFASGMKFSTQHGDEWQPALVIWPSGKASVYRQGIEKHLLPLVANQAKAKLQYARQIGRCCICGKTLTDERSRYFGIGPDCETRHLDVIGWVTDSYGPYRAGMGFDKVLDR